jgi:MFS family permease
MWSGVVLFVPLFDEHGFGTQEAAIALGLGGVGQVCGRLGYRFLHEHTTVDTRTRLVFGWVAATTLALALVPGPYHALVVLAMLAGAGRGVFTLIQATAVADRWGIGQYARLNGIATMPLLLTGALAPWIGFAVAQLVGSYAVTMVLMAAAAGLGLMVVGSAGRTAPIQPFRLQRTPGGR